MNAPYSAHVVANTFIDLYLKNGGEPPTKLHIMKMIYIAYGFYYVQYDQPLIGGAFKKWEYGSVMPKLYKNHFQQFADVEIDKYICAEKVEEEKALKIIQKAFEDFKKYRVYEFVQYTRGYAWMNVRLWEDIED